MSKDVISYLHGEWRDLVSHVEPQALRDSWWDRLCKLYCASDRAYHTLEHIGDMMRQLRALDTSSVVHDQEAVALAIFFHDAIYNPKSGDNEVASAQLLREFAHACRGSLLTPATRVEAAVDMILLTERHTTAVHEGDASTFGSGDEHYLLDLDMSVLGRPRHAYARYMRQIRVEYGHIPWQIYKSKRPSVLRTFLKTSNIYATHHFRSRLEAQARENVEAEARMLEAATPTEEGERLFWENVIA